MRTNNRIYSEEFFFLILFLNKYGAARALARPLFPTVSKMTDASASQESFIKKNLSDGVPITVQNRAQDAANVVDNIMSQQAQTLDETFSRKKFQRRLHVATKFLWNPTKSQEGNHVE